MKDWKLSVRLDRDLLSELYGAANQLASNRATVSSMVEEALRLYLPRLREQHNSGLAFPRRGPKARAASRSPLLAKTDSNSWLKIPFVSEDDEKLNLPLAEAKTIEATQVEVQNVAPPEKA